MPRYYYPDKWQDLFNQRQLTTGRGPTSEEVSGMREAEISGEQQIAGRAEQLGEQKRQFNVGQTQAAFQFAENKRLQEEQMAGAERGAKIGAVGQLAGIGGQMYAYNKMFPTAGKVATEMIGGTSVPVTTLGTSTAVDITAGGTAQPAMFGVSGLGPAVLGAGAGFVGGEIGKRVFSKSPREGGALGGAAMGFAVGGPIGGIIGGITGAISGNSKSVICTELYRQGLIDFNIYAYDSIYCINSVPSDVYQGYLKLCTPIAEKMKTSTLFSRFIAVFAIPTSKEMASRVNFDIKGHWIGKLVLKLGFPICRLAFNYGGELWPDMAHTKG